MFEKDGTFNEGHINNWQHAAMYLAYTVAGVVDVAAHFSELPADSGQVSGLQSSITPQYEASNRMT